MHRVAFLYSKQREKTKQTFFEKKKRIGRSLVYEKLNRTTQEEIGFQFFFLKLGSIPQQSKRDHRFDTNIAPSIPFHVWSSVRRIYGE